MKKYCKYTKDYSAIDVNLYTKYKSQTLFYHGIDANSDCMNLKSKLDWPNDVGHVLNFQSIDCVRYQSMQHDLPPPNHILSHKPLIGPAEAMEVRVLNHSTSGRIVMMQTNVVIATKVAT